MDKDLLKKKIMDRVKIDPETGCWNWIGRLNSRTNLPQLDILDKSINARKAAFEVFIGEILDKDIRIFNFCGNVTCVCPEHSTLRLPLNSEFASNCINGHEMTKDNTRIYKNGTKCLKCERERARIYRDKKFPTRRVLSGVVITSCVNGHPYVEGSYYINKLGIKYCKECKRTERSKREDKKNPHRRKRQTGGFKYCKNGHEFTPENTYLYSGYKVCRACKKDNRKKDDPK